MQAQKGRIITPQFGVSTNRSEGQPISDCIISARRYVLRGASVPIPMEGYQSGQSKLGGTSPWPWVRSR